MNKVESITCACRQEQTQALNLQCRGRYKVNGTVRVLTEASAYYLLIGRVIEVTEFNDSGIIEFTDATLRSARQPDRVTRAKRQVHFYWRELQGVIET